MGSLHETNPSLWVATARDPDPIRDTATAPPARIDVAVVGAGVTGLTTAYLLQQQGASVAVIEAGRVCSGVTGYTTAKISALQRTTLATIAERHSQEAATVYAEANLAAVEEMSRLVSREMIDCDFERARACTFTRSADEVTAIEAEHEAATAAGLGTYLDRTTDLPFEVEAAVWLDDQAQFHPRKYCVALADAIATRGGTIAERTRALDAATAGNGISLETSRGSIVAQHLVLATHLPFMDSGGFFARAHPQRSYAMAVRLQDEPPRGMYISAESPTRSMRSTPDGWFIVGGEGHKTGHDDDTHERYDALERWARENFAVGEVGYRWSAQDYETVDGIPYVGRLNAMHDRIWVATGFGKWGMTNGTAAAMILTDVIVGHDNPWAEVFDATRLAPGASLKKLITENIDVGKRFVADRVASWHPRSAYELDNDEGDLVDLDGRTVAAYRDPNGRLHAVGATCTHLGCRVTFNTAERTWDCPCHGSRFDIEGCVIQGPAVADLDTIDTDEPQ